MTIRSLLAFLRQDRHYSVLFKHTPNYTKFYGDGWTLFATDYGLKAGDIINISRFYRGLDFQVHGYRRDKMLSLSPHVGKTTQASFMCIYFYIPTLIFNFHL